MKNSPISNLSKLAMIIAAMILQISCQQDETYHPAEDSAIINLSVSASNGGTTTAGNDPASAIKSLCILQFTADGTNFGTLRHVGIGTETAVNSGKYTATLLQSINVNDKYKLVILANFPNSDYGIFYRLGGKSYDEIQQACLSEQLAIGTGVRLAFNGENPFPMFGIVQDGTSISINETMDLGAVSLVRAVARVDIGIGTKNADNTWNKGNVKFTMSEIQIRRVERQYAYMPEANNFSSIAGTLTISKPSPPPSPSPRPPEATDTKVYGVEDITSSTYCADKIYLPEALLWENGSGVYDKDHANRLAIIVGGYYNGSLTKTYYRVDFTNDQTDAHMNILRNHVYQFSVTNVTDGGYSSADLAYTSKPTNISFTAELAKWESGVTATVPNIIGYHISYGGLNGTVTTFEGLTIPKKQNQFGNFNMTFDYDQFYGEANSYSTFQNPAEQNGLLYLTVSDAFYYEGTSPALMVSGDDVLSSETDDNEHIPWKQGNVLTAFDVCRGYGGSGYDDWRLPRLSELAMIYGNKASLEALRGFTAISNDVYWSASEFQKSTSDDDKRGSDSVWAIDFRTGTSRHHVKTEKLRIRCVRSVKGTTANTLK